MTIGSEKGRRAVTPSAENAAAVVGKDQTVTFDIRHDDAQELSTRREMPQTNVADSASRKKSGGGIVGKGDVIDWTIVRRLK